LSGSLASDSAAGVPWFPVGEDRVRLLRDGGQALPTMLHAIAGAEREVLLEMYWIGNDAVGRAFRDVLRQEIAADPRVRAVYLGKGRQEAAS